MLKAENNLKKRNFGFLLTIISDLECLPIRKLYLLLRGDGIVFFRMRCARGFIKSTIVFQSYRPPGKMGVFMCSFVDGQTVGSQTKPP